MNDSSTCPRSPSRRALKWLLVAVAVVVLVLAPMRRILVPAFLELGGGQFAQFQHHLQSLGPWGPVLSIALLIAGALALPVPVTIIMVADGLVFGTQGGTLISFVGGLLGALCAYFFGRHISPSVLERALPVVGARVSAGATVPFVTWGVVLGHWIPGMPCNPMSYAAGCTRMPLLSFLSLTTVGLLPACAVTAYMGVWAAGDVPTHYWLLGVFGIGALWFGWGAVRRRNGGRESPPLCDARLTDQHHDRPLSNRVVSNSAL
jgi:uncharacterized membrane protein YdjX (TVP38/TMEM64 family)